MPVTQPQASLYADHDRTGLAKPTAAVRRTEDRALVAVEGPVYGLSWMDQDAVLGIGWENTNILPPELTDNARPRRPLVPLAI